jgi:hypothetical protein
LEGSGRGLIQVLSFLKRLKRQKETLVSTDGVPADSRTQHFPNTSRELFFFLNLCGGTLGTAATTGLLYQPRMIGDDDCGEIGGMKIGRGNRSTRRKPAPAPLYPPQIPHD